MADDDPRGGDPALRMRRAFAVGQDRKLLRLAVAQGLLTVAQQDEAIVEQAEQSGSLREILFARGWIGPADLADLEMRLAAVDFARPAAARPDPVPPEVTAVVDEPGRRLGDYVLVTAIGRGGAGEVWKAWDFSLRRWVAIKLASLPVGSRTARERFSREAVAVGRLDHPHILPIFQAGEADGRPFIVMPLSGGKPLSEVKLPLRQALEVVRTAALAVQHAHDRGVVHRDIKPANILVDDGGRVSVVDFGLAYLPDHDSRLTTPGDVLGTAGYMSPEQARGEEGANRAPTDIYSLGATLYELVAGRAPFVGDSFAALVARVAHDEPPPLRRLQASISRELETVIQTAMDGDPSRRYATAAALAEDLRRLLADEPINASFAGPLRRLGRRVRRSPLRAGIVVSGGVAVIAIALLAIGAVRRVGALDSIREMGALSLDAALQLRRAGDNEGMRRLLPRLRAAYDVAARRAPELAEVDYFMGRVYRALIDDDQALAFQEKALAKDPAYAPALYERAVLLSSAYGRERERVVELRRTLEASPVLAETAEQEVLSREDVERGRPALSRLREAVLRDCAALERALIARRGAAQPALPVSEAMVMAAHGVLAYHQGQHPEARRLLEQAVARDPQLEEAWEALAQSASAEKRWDEAVRAYGEGIARDRGYLPHRLGRSRLLMIRGTAHYSDPKRARADYAAAVDDLTVALGLDPKRAESWLRRALARTYVGFLGSQMGDDPLAALAAAETDAAEALRLAGPSVELHHALGILANYRAVYRERAGQDPLADFAAAVKAFSAVLALLPDDAWPRLWRGRTLMARGLHLALRGQDALAEFVAAEDDLARATRTRSPRAHAWEWLGFAATERGGELAARGGDPFAEWDIAEQAFDRALQVAEGRTWPLVRRATLWTRRGAFRADHAQDPEPDFARADADLARAIELAPEHPHAWLRRGMLSAERGMRRARRGESPLAHFAAADADYLHTLALSPRHADALTERGRMLLARAAYWQRKGATRKAAADRDDARKSVDQAVGVNPHYAHRREQLFAGL